MNIKFWSHKNGFRSPTEQQLVRWETDGGNHSECEDAILFEGRLYSCRAEMLKARFEGGVKKVAAFLRQRVESRSIQPSGAARTGSPRCAQARF